MFKRILFSSFLAFTGISAFAEDATSVQPAQQANVQPSEPVDSSAVQAVSSAVVQSSSSQAVSSSSEEAPKWREVPVRYWVNGDSV